MSLKRWHEVYQGGDERNFFIGKNGKSGLVRTDYNYRSVAALAKESGLTKDRVEQIVAKYLKLGIVVQSPDKEDHFGYWQRVGANLAAGAPNTVSQNDQAARVKKATAKKP